MNNNYNYYPREMYGDMNIDNFKGMFNLEDMNLQNSINNQNSSVNKLYGSYEGFIRGNMFKDKYDQYKNYMPQKLIPKNPQEQDLLNLNQVQFAMHEANLYLDVFPEDTKMMREFIKYRNQYNRLLNEYELKYGALNINSNVLNKTPFGWEINTWDRRGL